MSDWELFLLAITAFILICSVIVVSSVMSNKLIRKRWEEED